MNHMKYKLRLIFFQSNVNKNFLGSWMEDEEEWEMNVTMNVQLNNVC